MHRTNGFGWVWQAALAVALVVGGSSDAFAGWGSSGGWGGSSGGYGSSGGWGGSSGGYGSWGGSSGGGRHHHKLFHRHRTWGGSSGGGSSGGWSGGSSGGSSGGFYDAGWGGSSGGGSSGGFSDASWGGSSGYGGALYSPSYGMPSDGYIVPGSMKTIPGGAVPGTPADAPPKAADPMTESTSVQRADGTLIVEVPADAKIYVNDRLTTTPGESREYVSRNLVPGFNYAYDVRVEMQRDGKLVTESRKVNVRAGENTKIAFNAKPADEVQTSVTVKVPAGAKVKLGGNETNATGEVRIFRTSLKAGTEWKDYKVEVTTEVDGQTLTKEQTFDLAAGDSKELAFEFDASNVASR